ncbi:S-layer homology domain-containing protein [Brevibacillus choshinensis]|uniref:S-layer homology domain-containing protein n=1 Tax=Brevibacillus choshinensis TaxID=54911 RepID=UPI002E236D40|nr:S-layer homology domain-containing protein [Brevibacillus choshinensis]
MKRLNYFLTGFLIAGVTIGGLNINPVVGHAATQAAAVKQNDYQNRPDKAAIEYVVKNKLMWLYPDGNFRPDQTITQADLIAGLSNVKSLSQGVAVPELPANHWAKAYYERAKKEGILNGIAINPSKVLTREEAAQIIVNAWQNVRAFITKKNDEINKGASYVQFVSGYKQMKPKAGKFPNGVATSLYDSFGTLTRADLAYTLSVLKKDFLEVREAERIAEQMHKSIKISSGFVTVTAPKLGGVLEAKYYIVTKSGEYLDTLQTGYLKHSLADTQRVLVSIRNKETNIGLVDYRYSKLPSLVRERVW